MSLVSTEVDGRALADRRARHARYEVTRGRSIFTGMGVPGEMEWTRTSRSAPSTAVHWLIDGHATADSAVPAVLSTTISGLGLPGRWG